MGVKCTEAPLPFVPELEVLRLLAAFHLIVTLRRSVSAAGVYTNFFVFSDNMTVFSLACHRASAAVFVIVFIGL